jgi:CheY-like chemotaxis protein
MPKTCLIAAHDPWFIQLLRMYSEECGLRVVQAFDGPELLTKALIEQPAAILLRTDLTGITKTREMLASLKNDPFSAKIPVIVFSWQGMGEESIEGAAVNLTEPVSYDSFVSALELLGVIPSGSMDTGNGMHDGPVGGGNHHKRRPARK